MKLTIKEAIDLLEQTNGVFAKTFWVTNMKPKDLASSYSLEVSNGEILIKQLYPNGEVCWIELDDQEKAKAFLAKEEV